MKARVFLVVLAVAIAIVASAWHSNAERDLAQFTAEARRLDAARAATARHNSTIARELAAEQRKLEDLLAERAHSTTAAPGNSGVATSSAPRANMDPEVRRLRLQAFVSDQRLRYAGLLKHVGFDGPKLQEFDRIVAACEEVVGDPAQDNDARRDAIVARDAALESLFGSRYEEWRDAMRNEPARFKLSQIVQQMFASAGTLTTGQTAELTRVLAEHRTPPSGRAPEQYDWDAVIASAHAILTPEQHQAFATAVEFRRASEKLTALTTRKR